MEKFIFLFRGASYEKLSPQEQEANMGKWLAWIEKLTKEGKYLAGEPLLPTGKVVAGPKKLVTDGPFVESKEIIGGFFMVNAKNYDDAVNMAKDCPDYDLGGVVEVREVMKVDMPN